MKTIFISRKFYAIISFESNFPKFSLSFKFPIKVKLLYYALT